MEKDIKLPQNENKLIKLAIWDTAGQEMYNAVAPVYYRDAVGAIIVYEITSNESFEKVKKWVTELREHANNKDIVIMIAGNKCDMESSRRVPKKEAENFAKANNALHYLVSAKSGANITELFTELGNSIFESKKNSEKVLIGKGRNPRIRIEDVSNEKDKEKKKKECC